MKEQIISTKGTSKRYKNGNMVSDSMFIILGAVLLIMFFYNESEAIMSDATPLMLVGLLIMLYGIASLLIHRLFATSYVDIYADKYVGKGIQQFNLVDFNVTTSQISNITIDNSFIFINTASGRYKIISNKETARKVFEHYNNSINA